MMADVSSPNGTQVLLPARPRQAPPVAIVIFGASGDLTQRKLIPALFDLFEDGLLTRDFAVLGFGRTPLSDAQFRETLKDGVQRFSRHTPLVERAWASFSRALHYQRG